MLDDRSNDGSSRDDPSALRDSDISRLSNCRQRVADEESALPSLFEDRHGAHGSRLQRADYTRRSIISAQSSNPTLRSTQDSKRNFKATLCEIAEDLETAPLSAGIVLLGGCIDAKTDGISRGINAAE